MTTREKEILIEAVRIKEKARLTEKEFRNPRKKSIYLSMFFTWLNNEYPTFPYISNLYFDMQPHKQPFFKNFKSLYPPDVFIMVSSSKFHGFAMYYFMHCERLKAEKEAEIKRLRELGYFAISVTSLDEAKSYFTQYMNLGDTYLK